MSAVSTSTIATPTNVASIPLRYEIIQKSDFYVTAGILHPIVIGSIAIVSLFVCLRLSSNRSIAPITVFDWIVNVALGSTLAGIVNGNSLVRGILALGTMLAFQYLTSTFGSRWRKLEWIFQGPPLVLAFDGEMLKDIMRQHRLSDKDVNAALRQHGLLNICQVECAIVEPNGTISIFTKKQLENSNISPDVLMAIPAYKALCETRDSTERGNDSMTIGPASLGRAKDSTIQSEDRDVEMDV